MDEQQIREVAEAAFKRQFADVEIVRINVWPGLGFEDDSPVVDVNIIYDGEYEQLNGRGFVRVMSEKWVRFLRQWAKRVFPSI